MIKRQISFLFEDPGFCIDVFCTIAEPVRYYNRDTESGAWYSSTPDWNENGSLIREDLIFEVIADGVVCALDGNGNFEGKKPFVPFCQFRQSLVQSVHTQYPHLQNQEALREKLLSLPDARETVGHGWYWENWLFATDVENSPPALCLPTTVSGTKEPKPNLLDMTYCSMTGKTNDHTASKNAATIHKEDAK